MRLDDLCDVLEGLRFPTERDRAHPDRALVLAARSTVAAAVIDDAFLADCISAELRLLENTPLRRGLLPFFILPGFGVRIAFGYWSPGATPGPHEHTAWTITAVCRNELEVLTYNREESYRQRQLVAKNRFHAPAGKTGFIFEPCIHEPRNSSQDWTLSLHLGSPRDGDCPGDYQESLPALNTKAKFAPVEHGHPYTSVLVARQRNRFVHQLARTLTTMNVPQAPDLLAKCARLGTSATGKLIDKALPPSSPTDLVRSPQLLVRTHKDLTISHRRVGDMVALDVETSKGRCEEFAINDLAREAMAFVAREPEFEVRAIPGNLSEDERAAIAELLEETGLFRGVAQ